MILIIKTVGRTLLVVALCGGAMPARAQSQTGGAIEGTVVDQSGGVLPGVAISARNAATGLTRETVTDGSGAFHLLLLPVGTYSIKAELQGFTTVERSGVTVEIGQAVNLRIEMRVATVAETITVTAESPIVETTRTQVSNTVNERAVQNLPVNGRNFIDFALLTPGVTRDVRLGDISFAGQRGTLNSLVVDGADNNNTFFGQALGRTGSGRAPYQFSQDAVKEFQVNSNSYSAEYGRAGGAVINVITKSGTNEVHGSIFEFYRDRSLNANSFINKLNNRPKSPYHYNQFGTTLGGPIQRDKHFFFFDYDGQRNTQPNLVFLNLVGAIPTDAATQAALGRLRPLAESWNRTQDQDVFLIKTDHQLSNDNRLSIRYNHQKFTGEGFENGGTQNSLEHTGASLVKTDTVNAQFQTVISSRWFNEVRFQYARDREPGKANSASPEATVRQNGQTVLTIGRNFFSPRETTIKRWQFADTLTFVRGAHKVKVGGDVNVDNILNFFPGNFSGAYTFQSLASFNGGTPNGPGERYVQAFPGAGTTGPTTHPDIKEVSVFAQDEWRVSTSLTFNLGVRYDVQSFKQPSVKNQDPQLLAAGIDTSKLRIDKNNVGPRVGFAWTPASSGDLVVRGGYGIFYGRTPSIMVGTAHSNNAINVQTITFTGALVPTHPNTFSNIPAGVALPKPTIFVFSPNYQNPLLQQASVGVEYGLAPDLSVGANALYVHGTHLQRSIDTNIGAASTVTSPTDEGGLLSYIQFSPAARPFANFDRVIQFQDTAHSVYRGLTLEINKRYSHNIQARLAYTLGKVTDDVPDATAVVPGSFDDAKFASNPIDTRADYTVGGNDQRHRLVFNGLWTLHYADGLQNAVARAILGGWSFSWILTGQSGQPYSAVMGFTDLNRDGNNRNDLAPGFKRNSFRFPSFWSFDPRVTRDIPLPGGARLQLIAEAFNVTNRVNINSVRNTYYSLVGGVLVRQASFGTPLGTSDPRIAQLAAKIVW